MKNPKKVRILITLVIVAYLLCILEGLKIKQRVKKDNESFYESVFRKGYGEVVFYATSVDRIIEKISQLLKNTKIQNTT